MRKLLITVIIFIMFLSFSSCIFEIDDGNYPPCPYGKWENKTVGLILDIQLSQGKHYFWYGNFYNHGEEKKIYISITYFGGMSIYDANEYDLIGSDAQELFCGLFQVERDKLYFTLTSRSQEITGITEIIVFDKIEDYKDSGVSDSEIASFQDSSTSSS